MKTLKRIAILVAMVLGLGLLASCNPTMGMVQIDADDVTTDWVKGTWTGSYSVKYSDGTKDSGSLPEFDCDASILGVKAGQVAFIALLKGFATTGDLYVNGFKTKVMYYEEYKNDDGAKGTATITYERN